MKNYFVRMSLEEKVLDSYLLRVMSGKLIEKEKYKVVTFSEINMINKNWTERMLRDFCKGSISAKTTLRIYKTERGIN